RLATKSGESVPPRVQRRLAELLLDPEQLVVLGDALAAGWSARLDLPGIRRHREVGDRRVFGLSRAVRDDARIAVLARETDRLERLRERADLVHLHEDRVGDVLVDAALQPLPIRHEHVVADELHAVPEPR